MPKIIKKLVTIEKRLGLPRVSFCELNSDNQEKVAQFIFDNKLEFRPTRKKWFDILTNKFYVESYPIDETGRLNWQIKTRDFNNFDDFYDFAGGDIYSHSCYYGYKFNGEKIKRYRLDLTRLNFDAFIDYTIDDFSWARRVAKRKSIIAEGNLKRSELLKILDETPTPVSLQQLEEIKDGFEEKHNFHEADILFSLLLARDSAYLKGVWTDCLSKHGPNRLLPIFEFILAYGDKEAEKIIDQYPQGSWERECAERILNAHRKKEITRSTKVDFCTGYQLYRCRETYTLSDDIIDQRNSYFPELSALAKFLNYDLSGADLSDAPIGVEEVRKYKTDCLTRFPRPFDCQGSMVRKYKAGNFVVVKEWFNQGIIDQQICKFDHFFDFTHFLKGDLSYADLIMCDGLENAIGLPGLKFEGVKMRSAVAELIGHKYEPLPSYPFNDNDACATAENELATIESYEIRPAEFDYGILDPSRIYYISDIHLPNRFAHAQCRSHEDREYVLRKIVDKMVIDKKSAVLVGGDVSYSYDDFMDLLRSLEKSGEKIPHFFFVLGNHELWPFPKQSLNKIYSHYREVTNTYGKGHFHLIQNNLYYLDSSGWQEIKAEELSAISIESLTQKTRKSSIVIFGGTGFAGTNPMINADSGMYQSSLSRKKEIAESRKFLELHNKIVSAISGRTLIVLTHMPISDWGGSLKPADGVIYVNGHTHRNYHHDDGHIWIFADNQVGRGNNQIHLKRIPSDLTYDYFASYNDGIYEISRDDYQAFNDGLNLRTRFFRDYLNLYMLKRDGNYLFLIKTTRGRLSILKGGALKSAGDHDLSYFYENLGNYAQSIRAFMQTYLKRQTEIANAIKAIGGWGTIHGCIIDINYWNHVFLNPFDGAISSYSAKSIIEKYFYKTLPGLLKAECPNIYSQYRKLLRYDKRSSLPAIIGSDKKENEQPIYSEDTTMYKISRIIKGLQVTSKCNVVRIWNEELVDRISVQNGGLIVSEMLDYKENE